MPLDIEVVYAGGFAEYYNIPLLSMYGAKKDPKYDAEPAAWTHPTPRIQNPF